MNKKNLENIAQKITGKNVKIKRASLFSPIYILKDTNLNFFQKTVAAGIIGLTSMLGCTGEQKIDTKACNHYIEQNLFDKDLKTRQTRYEMTQDGKKVFTAEHQEIDYTRASARPFIKMPGIYEGYVTVFGESKHNSDANNFGADFDVKTDNSNIILGGTFEKTIDSTLKNVYAGKEFKNFIAKTGIAELDNNTILQAMFGKTLEIDNTNGICAGVGGLYDKNGFERTGKSQIDCYIRKYTEKGKSLGAELWAKSDLDGNFSVKSRVALRGSNLTKSFAALDFKGVGLNELSIVPNVIERLPPDYTSGDTVIVVRYDEKATGAKTGILAVYNNFGNLGFFKDLNIGIKETFKEGITSRTSIITPSVCFNIGPIGFYYEVGVENGNAPNHYVSVWTSFSDIYKALGGK